MKSVIKGAGYILVHTPDMVIHNGTTQTTERIVNPESEYLKELPGHIRSFEDVLSARSIRFSLIGPTRSTSATSPLMSLLKYPSPGATRYAPRTAASVSSVR